MKNKIRKYCFTLLEVMVAMAVFAVIALIMLQFFTGAQRLWRDSESKNDVYGNARIAMDLMSSMLQSTYYAVDGTPFIIHKNSPAAGFDQITFATRSPLRPRGSSDLFFVSFKVNDDNSSDNRDSLEIHTLVNEDSGYTNALPPNTYAAATGYIDSYFQSAREPIAVVPHVTGLQFTPLVNDYAAASPESKLNWNPGTATPGKYAFCPAAVKIEIRLLSKSDYNTWNDKGRDPTFREERERTFSRIVYIGGY